MNRRQFTLGLGASMLGLAKPLAAALLKTPRRAAEPLDALASQLVAQGAGRDAGPSTLEHWRIAQNNTWKWYERSSLIDGAWVLTGMTTPEHRQSGEAKHGIRGYLDKSLVPAGLAEASGEQMTDFCVAAEGADPGPAATDLRRTREGRPPSRWIRSLGTDELRTWLSMVEPGQAGVAGMTFMEHLTRDHGFKPENVALLSEAEQAILHAAAHHGY